MVQELLAAIFSCLSSCFFVTHDFFFGNKSSLNKQFGTTRAFGPTAAVQLDSLNVPQAPIASKSLPSFTCIHHVLGRLQFD